MSAIVGRSEQRRRSWGKESSGGQRRLAWDRAAAVCVGQRSAGNRGTEQRRRVGQSSTRFDLFLNFFIYMHVLDVFLNFVEFTLILGLSARFILLSK